MSIRESKSSNIHPSADALLEFIQGTLSGEESLAIENHLDQCEACCDRLEEIDARSGLLDAIRDASQPELLADIEAASIDSNVTPCQAPQNRYELIREIAQGGMGVVYEAYDHHLCRNVAIKTLRPDSDLPVFQKRFAAEARISAHLNHPGVPPTYDLGLFTDGRPYLSMKLVGGKTLQECIVQEKDRSMLLTAFVKLCECIGYAHSQGIIHRDLKPENIMLGDFGEMQVMDWGLAKNLTHSRPDGGIASDSASAFSETFEFVDDVLLEDNPPESQPTIELKHRSTQASKGNRLPTRVGTILGTPAYMAPEQANGRTDLIDKRTDIFGLGAVLCEILTGTPPYPDHDEHAALQMAKNANLALVEDALLESGVDPELKILIKQCLAKDPDERPQDATHVGEAIEEWNAGIRKRLRESELAMARSQAKVREEIRRRRTLLALVVSVISFTLIGTVFWLFYQQQQNAFALKSNQSKLTSLMKAQAELTLFDQFIDKVQSGVTITSNEWQIARGYINRAATHSARLTNEKMHKRVVFAKRLWNEHQEAIQADEQLLDSLSLLDGLIPLGPRPQPSRDPRRKDEPGGEGNKLRRFQIPGAPEHNEEQEKRNSLELSNIGAMAFLEYGIDAPNQSSARVVSFIQQRPKLFQKELLGYIHLWMHHAVVADKIEEARWLKELADQLDQDDKLAYLRAAIVERDDTYIALLVNEPVLEQFPPELLWSGANMLKKSFPKISLELLKLAQLSHMGSPFINRDLANELKRADRGDESGTFLMLNAATQGDTQKRAWALIHLADNLIEQEHYTSAFTAMKQALHLYPEIVPENRFCHLARYVDDPRIVISSLDEMLSSGLLITSEPWIELGDAYFDIKDFPNAKKAFDKAIELGIARPARFRHAETYGEYSAIMTETMAPN